MDMYAIQLGKAGEDGFKPIEVQKGLGSTKNEMEQRAMELLRTRGVQLGANRVRLLVGLEDIVWEYP